MNVSREFVSQAGNLKETKRWSHPTRKIEGVESVADHTFRAALLALLLPRSGNVDREKVIRMLLVHDLAESDPDVGDITPHAGVSREEKARREEQAMRKLCASLPDGSEVLDLWLEYEENRTEEAHIAHDFDALERSLQVREYRMQGRMPDEEALGIMQNDYKRIRTETVRRMFEVLIRDA